MEKVFLTKEEIKTITDLQTKEEKFISQLGTLEYQLQILLKQKKELKDSIDPLQVEKEKLAKLENDSKLLDAANKKIKGLEKAKKSAEEAAEAEKKKVAAEKK